MTDKKRDGLGDSTVYLGDGRTIELTDWVYGGLRSAAIFSPYADSFEPSVFGYSRGMAIPGADDMMATAVHTNLPRSGDNGLPRDWEMLVYHWKATCDLPLDQPVIDFASACACEFIYNGRTYRHSLLIELLLGGAATQAQPGTHRLPIWMKDHMSFGMSMRCESRAAFEAFRDYLRKMGPLQTDPTVLAELDQLARVAKDPAIGVEIRRIQKKLQPGRHATFWGHIEGYIKRVVF